MLWLMVLMQKPLLLIRLLSQILHTEPIGESDNLETIKNVIITPSIENVHL